MIPISTLEKLEDFWEVPWFASFRGSGMMLPAITSTTLVISIMILTMVFELIKFRVVGK